MIDKDVLKYFYGFDSFFKSVKAEKYPIENVFNEFKSLFETTLDLFYFKLEFQKLTLKDVTI